MDDNPGLRQLWSVWLSLWNFRVVEARDGREAVETAVRERIPILSVLLNNFSMAIEIPVMKTAAEKYRSTDISGHYADMARAFGGYGERVTEPDEIVPAIERAVAKTREGTPCLLEFITEKETTISTFGR